MQLELCMTCVPLTFLNSVDHLLHLPIPLYIVQHYKSHSAALLLKLDMQYIAVCHATYKNKSLGLLQTCSFHSAFILNLTL